MVLFLYLYKLLVIASIFDHSILAQESNNQIDLVETLTTSPDECKELCSRDHNCVEWNFLRNNSHNVKKHSCYLQSKDFALFKHSYPIHFPSGDSGIEVRKSFFTEKLLVGPAILDSTSLINYDQHFYRSCNYTISLWVWLWKRKRPGNREVPIFTSQASNPNLDKFPPLYPSIIYNVGYTQERFFFSATRDNKGGYEGFWPPVPVRYHEWMHLAISISDKYVMAFINGELFGPVYHNRQTEHRISNFCPYSASSPYHSRNMTEYLNNTVFHLGGVRGGYSSPGMVQDVIIFKNISMTQTQIQDIISERRPLTSQFNKRLLKMNGIYSLEDYCPIDWMRNGYVSVRWGLCPDSLCGPICLDEAFLLGHQSIGGFDWNTHQSIMREGITGQLLVPDIGTATDIPYVEQMLRDELDAIDEYIDGMSDEFMIYEDYGGSGAYGEDSYAEYDDRYVGDEEYAHQLLQDYYDYLDDYAEENQIIRETATLNRPRKTVLQRSPNMDKGRVSPHASPAHETSPSPGANEASQQSRGRSPATKDTMGTSDELDYSELPRRASNKKRSKSTKNTDSKRYSVFEAADGWRSMFSYTEAKQWFWKQLYKPVTSLFGIYKSQNISETNDKLDEGILSDDSDPDNGLRATSESSSKGRRITKAELRTRHQIMLLYDAAFAWLNGRHADMEKELNMSFGAWQHQVRDRAFSSLALALWLSDGLNEAVDVQWNFLYPGMTSQPIHIALGFQYEVDLAPTVPMPANLGIYLQNILGSDILSLDKSEENVFRYIPPSEKLFRAGHESVTVSTDGDSQLDDVQMSGSLERLLNINGYQLVAEFMRRQPFSDGLNLTQLLSSEPSLRLLSETSGAKKVNSTFEKLRGLYLERPWVADVGALSSPLGDVECRIAASHYFGVAQHVVSHFGMPDVDVGFLENVLIENANIGRGFRGEDDQLHQHMEAEAAAGDSIAQLWLARRYFWGLGGVPRNMPAATR